MSDRVLRWPAAVLATAVVLLVVALVSRDAGPGPGVLPPTVVPEAPPTAADPREPLPAWPPPSPDYRFLSSPDFLNADIGDLRTLPGWEPGEPNSWSPSYEQTLDRIVDRFAAERPEDVLVAGDLVEGQWGFDREGLGVFGPTATEGQQVAALHRAADFYYDAWVRRFATRGLRVHAAVGDHELGDNPWHGDGFARFKRDHVRDFKRAFAHRLVAPRGYRVRPGGPARHTAYATRLHPEVLLVTLDVFRRSGDDVVADLDPRQLAWVDRVLADARSRGVDWVVVQGHTPIAGPVPAWGSSELTYEGGTGSRLWRVMARHGVDLYLNGEVHEVSAVRADGITQVSHGGLIGAIQPSGVGGTTYLLGEVHRGRLFLTVNRFVPTRVDASSRLWENQGRGPAAVKHVAPDPVTVGRMVLNRDNRLLGADGALVPRPDRP